MSFAPQFHGMDEEAFQHASLAAAAAAAAMPQLTKLALEHKQRRASASESSGAHVLSPFASEANSTTTGFVPRNREAADLGLLTELASQAAVSAICSPRTRASSRRASRGASSEWCCVSLLAYYAPASSPGEPPGVPGVSGGGLRS
eukprot:1160921-Pelagomonas_calceolata.AAC.5